jgi:translation initiation factor 2 subunit 1
MEFPEKDELVIVIIRKILPYGAFCILPEYNNMEAFLHVSEVAPRWIKNIHEFISEGQQHVAKVYRLDREKNQVDISLKRVNEEEKKSKLEITRTEKRATKLLALAITNSKTKAKEEEIRSVLEKEFGDLWSAFLESMEQGESALEKVDIPKPLKSQIVGLAKKNIKPPTVDVIGDISLTCFGSNGVEEIKKVLAVKESDVSIQYLGAPKYRISLVAQSHKDGQKRLNKIIEKMENLARKNKCDFSFELQRS